MTPPTIIDNIVQIIIALGGPSVIAFLTTLAVKYFSQRREASAAKKADAESQVIEAQAVASLKDSAASMVETMQKRLNNVIERLNDVEDDKARLHATNEQILKELAEQHIFNARLVAENKALKEDLCEMRVENQTLKSELAAVKSENTQLKQRVQELEAFQNNTCTNH